MKTDRKGGRTTKISQPAWRRINVTTAGHDGICCTYVLLCDIQIRLEERRIRWRQRNRTCKQWPLGALAILQIKIITTPNWLIKSEIALWWQTDALHAGGESGTNISSVISQLLILSCVCSCNYTNWNVLHSRGRQLLQESPTVMLPDRIPLGKVEISESTRICPPASTEAQEHLAAPLPASLQEQLPPSCCELCNSGVYSEGAPPVGTQTRTYNLSRMRMEAGRESVPAVLQLTR